MTSPQAWMSPRRIGQACFQSHFPLQGRPNVQIHTNHERINPLLNYQFLNCGRSRTPLENVHLHFLTKASLPSPSRPHSWQQGPPLTRSPLPCAARQLAQTCQRASHASTTVRHWPASMWKNILIAYPDIIKSIKRLIADPKVPAIKARISRQKCHLRQNSINCEM